MHAPGRVYEYTMEFVECWLGTFHYLGLALACLPREKPRPACFMMLRLLVCPSARQTARHALRAFRRHGRALNRPPTAVGPAVPRPGRWCRLAAGERTRTAGAPARPHPLGCARCGPLLGSDQSAVGCGPSRKGSQLERLQDPMPVRWARRWASRRRVDAASSLLQVSRAVARPAPLAKAICEHDVFIRAPNEAPHRLCHTWLPIKFEFCRRPGTHWRRGCGPARKRRAAAIPGQSSYNPKSV